MDPDIALDDSLRPLPPAQVAENQCPEVQDQEPEPLQLGGRYSRLLGLGTDEG